ncbi:hypothetical protein [Micromonospora nigra]|uniref:hypothetical protein n=1 Tax=Micromonospora nigra TaxID=145857 RepID=UPI00158618C9|nr:hypothetical protein [Micromonospora nigra]
MAFGLLVALAACDGNSAGTTADGSPATRAPADASASAASASSAAASSSSDAQQPSWEDETDPERRLQGCLVGTFVLDRDAWSAGITALLERDLSSVRVEDSGKVTFELKADRTYTLTADDSRTVSFGSSPGGDIRWVLGFDGTESGTWTARAGQLALKTGSGGRLAADNEMSIDGQQLPTNALPVSGTPWSQKLTTKCDSDGFVATPAGEPDAVKIVLTRLG